ncbi:MAG: S9 family peptidase [Bacteroidetes bacterium]|nr:MAG: S9 family peptidase [Bacteroidota bacterium]
MKKLTGLFLLFLFGVATSAQTDHRLTPEGLWSLGRVSLYDLSPDGKTVLYGVTKFDIGENKGNRDLFTVPAKGGEARQITRFEGNESEAQFRPDGKKIGFLKGGKLWEMNPDGFDAHAISDEQMNGFKYSPDGKNILFIRDVAFDKTTQQMYPDLPKANARIIDDLMYRHWNEWEDGAYSNIFVAPYESGKIAGTPKNIMNEPFDSPLKPFGGMEQINWSPDGRFIAYTCKKVRGKDYAVSTDSDVYLYELATGQTTNLTEGMDGYDMEPVFSPDGQYLAWLSMATPGYESDRNRIFVYHFPSDKKWEISENWDRSAGNLRWAPNGEGLYFTSGEQATIHLFYVGLNDETPTQLTFGDYNYYDYVVGKRAAIIRRCSMSEPHELFRVDLKSKTVEPLTFTNKAQLSDIKMGKVEKRWMKTTDGKNMLVWMIFPPDFDPQKKYPALLYCQGGPQSTVSQFWSYRWNFQIMAANGYIVVAPNRRGLPSFGQAWNDEIAGDWGGQPMQDLLAAIDQAKTEPYVDENRLGAVGASYGGYSVYWLAGNHNHRFKTFIAHGGLYNLESWYGTTEELFFANHDLHGPYFGDAVPATYLHDSPHKFAQNWDTPILIIHGEQDFRVPVSEGMQAFQTAKLKGIPARFLSFPDEGHWIMKPQNGILWQRVFFDWLDRSLKKNP